MALTAELSVNFVVPRGRLRGHPPPTPRCYIEANERNIEVQKHRNFCAVLFNNKFRTLFKKSTEKGAEKRKREQTKSIIKAKGKATKELDGFPINSIIKTSTPVKVVHKNR